MGSSPLMDPFYQEPKTTTIVYHTFNVATLTVNSRRWKEVMDNRQQGAVVFRIDIMAAIRFKVSTWGSQHHKMHANCDVAVGQDGSILPAWKNKKCILVLCLWLALRPGSPHFTITNFSVPAVNDSNTSDHGIIQYQLDIKNPNKDSGIYYDDILLIFYHGVNIVGNNTIPSFTEGKNRSHQVLNHFDVDNPFWAALRSAILNATAELRVDLSTKVRYKTWLIKSRHHGLHREGHIPIGKDGKISNKKKKVKLRDASK
ncbi:hypothetical protein Godav_025284 [Gossypium davidsonii]|nr:hypothetical protein [Gossypium davidsonii]